MQLTLPPATSIFLRTYGKVVALIVTMIIGAFVPQAGVLAFLVQYLLMVMLFNTFLDIDFRVQSLQISILWVLLANVAVALGAYGVFAKLNSQLALAAFITAIAPTAISSTVIVNFIRGRVDFMVTAVLITNVSIAIIAPLILPFILESSSPISTWEVLHPVLVTMFVPLILAQLVNRLPAGPRALIHRGKRSTFLVWLINLFIISAKASAFIRGQAASSLTLLLQIALVALLICVVNFSLGALLGGRQHRQETSQALGQKNNSFAIWIALTFINPLVAMGPTFYVLYHNLYNTWQIYRYEKHNHNP